MNGNKSNEGQVLLLLIMVLGTLLIVAMTAIFQSSTDTQISGTTQLSQTTLAASEAGLQKGLLDGTSGTYAELGITNLTNIDLNNSRVEVVQPNYSVFTTQRQDADTQYTFYLADYTPATAAFGGAYNIIFEVYYESPNKLCTDIALEFTFVYDQNGDGTYDTAKRIADPGFKLAPTLQAGSDIYSSTGTYPVNGYTFQCKTSQIILSSGTPFPNAKFVMIQSYLNGTKYGFKAISGGQMPPQGKLITATARAQASRTDGTATPVPQTGLTRVTQIFQSYPQIPAEFWTTSF